ncbi:MAG: hypothetical protein PHF99_07250 [Bacteroidales bacterium]|nr:hypothetical protein [Bacteroidales bacterium]MDD4235794.1 hypothetical protein [Bacteroidales bacterium]
MKTILLLILFALTLYSCKNKEEITIKLPQPKIEGATHEIMDSSYYIINTPEKIDDELTKKNIISDTVPKLTDQNQQIIPESETINDTIFYYYVNNKVSVKITPWKNGKRDIKFYDLYGNNTYNQEEIKLSYSVFCDLVFGNNGAVEKMNCTTNPGASRFWHESEISFNGTNSPVWKKTYTKPAETINDAEGKTWFWDKNSNNWKKQEVINCNPPR